MPSKKPPQFTPTQRLVREYEQGIGKILGRVLPPKRPEQSFQEWIAAIALRSQEKDIQEASTWLAGRMVHAVSALNMKTWRQAAERSQQSRKLYALLQKEMQGRTGARVREIVLQNAAYIRSIPLTQASVLTAEILKAEQQGARPETVAKMARTRFPELLRSRVKLIARTETAKASTALTRARCEELDIQFYQWMTAEDSRVRLSHKKLNGVVIPWADPPSPEALVGEKSTLGHYHSGDSPNCRCTQRPVLTLSDLSFPARVYFQGTIHTMTKQQFIAQFGHTVEEREAA